MVSDGIATPESVKQDDAIAAARSAGIPVFPVLVNYHPRQGTGIASGPLAAAAGIVSSVETSQSAFGSLGEATGGRAFLFSGGSPANLVDQILTRIAREIRYEYVAGYTPARSRERAKHNVEIVLKNANLGKVVGGVRDVEY